MQMLRFGRQSGFTLAELLVALAILGVIATFTIPKVLSAQNDSKNKAMAKEAAATVSGAYQAWKESHTLQVGNTAEEILKPYINYVSEPSGSTAIQRVGNTIDCSYVGICLLLHSGGYLALDSFYPFTGTGNLDAVRVFFDPDGPKSTPGVWFLLYANGRITTYSTAPTGTNVGALNIPPTPGSDDADPSWFNWN